MLANIGTTAAEFTNPGYLLSPAGAKQIGETAYNGAKSLVKPVYDTANAIKNVANNWRPWVPRDATRYYRIVGASGDAVEDAVASGVIRGPGAVPGRRAAVEAATKDPNTITLLSKQHDYPMFAKGKPWTGSTSRSRIDANKKPIIIRSKKDTGPIVWEESNKDFRHKGHKGIFRPNYYGDVNASPIKYFEYWEPKRFGYMKREFPIINPGEYGWGRLDMA
jgi:hypothetical protein